MAAYIHGFGLLAFRKFYPKVKPYIDEAITNITTQGTSLPVQIWRWRRLVEKLAPAMTPIITAITGPGLPEAGNADVPKLGVWRDWWDWIGFASSLFLFLVVLLELVWWLNLIHGVAVEDNWNCWIPVIHVDSLL
jgi:hypothetical protein